MRKTLLEMVQNILNEMDSDEVNSINDTVESQQVANIIKSCYNEMISNRNWPHLKKLVQLDSLSDIEKPNYLKLPKGMKEMIYLQYNGKDVKYKYPEDYLRYVSLRKAENDNVVEVTDFSGVKLLVWNNAAPAFWTSFDDEHVVMDSYDSTVDDTLQASKTLVLAYIEPAWEHTDEAIPNLPEEAFAALEEEAKSTAFITVKQMANQKAEQKAARQNRWLSRKAWRANGGVQYETYGRKGRR